MSEYAFAVVVEGRAPNAPGDQELTLRFSVPGPLSFAAIAGGLKAAIGEEYHPEWRVTYLDEDGDEVVISSDRDVAAAAVLWQGSSAEEPAMLFAKPVAFEETFRSGPPPQYRGAYFAGLDGSRGSVARDLQPHMNDLASRCSRALAQLCPGGVVAPELLPSWLVDGGGVILTSRGHLLCDVDVDFGVLPALLHRQALRFLAVNLFGEARNLLSALLELDPLDMCAHYNLACTFSKMGDVDSACRSLEVALDAPKDYLSLAGTDPDFDPIRSAPAFVALLGRTRAKRNLALLRSRGVEVTEATAQLLSQLELKDVSEPK